LRRSSSIDVHPLFENSTAEIRIFETTDGEQINLAPQGILKMMEQSKKPPGELLVRLIELNEQVNITSASSLATCQ
jgi:hypothetical protein